MGALGIAFAHPRVIILASLVRKESVALSGCLVWQTHEETLLFNVDVFSVDAADFANPETSFLRDSGSKAKTWVGDFALVDSGLYGLFPTNRICLVIVRAIPQPVSASPFHRPRH